MLNLPSEDSLPIREVPAEIQKTTGQRPHLATIWRWVQRGCRGVKLETVLVGGRRFTSRQAIQNFVLETTAAADGNQSAETVPSAVRIRAIKEADRDFDEAGI